MASHLIISSSILSRGVICWVPQASHLWIVCIYVGDERDFLNGLRKLLLRRENCTSSSLYENWKDLSRSFNQMKRHEYVILHSTNSQLEIVGDCCTGTMLCMLRIVFAYVASGSWRLQSLAAVAKLLTGCLAFGIEGCHLHRFGSMHLDLIMCPAAIC